MNSKVELEAAFLKLKTELELIESDVQKSLNRELHEGSLEKIFLLTGGDVNDEKDDEIRKLAAGTEMESGRIIVRILLLAIKEENNKDLVVLLLKIIKNLARNYSMMERLVIRDGAGGAIFETFLCFPGEAVILEEGLGALVNLSTNDDNQLFLCGLGAAEFISKVMLVDLKNEKLLERGLECLLRLSLNPANRKLCLQLPLSVVIEAITSQPTSTIVEKGFFIIATLASESDALQRFETLHVFDCMTRLMTQFRSQPLVGEAYCRCVSLLCLKPSFQGTFPSGRLEKTMLQVVQLNGNTQESIAEYFLISVRNASANNVPNKLSLTLSGSALLVVTVTNEHLKSPKIVLCGLTAIWSLANHPETKAYLVDVLKADILAITALRTHVENMDIAIRAIACLSSLANLKANKRTIMSNGGGEAVLRSIRMFLDRVNSNNHDVIMGEEGESKKDSNDNNDHHHNGADGEYGNKLTNLVLYGSTLIWSLSMNDENKYLLVNLGILQLLLDVFLYFSNRNDTIVYNVFEALRSLCVVVKPMGGGISNSSVSVTSTSSVTVETLVSFNFVTLVWPTILRRKEDLTFIEVACDVICKVLEDPSIIDTENVRYLRNNELDSFLSFLGTHYEKKKRIHDLIERFKNIVKLDKNSKENLVEDEFLI